MKLSLTIPGFGNIDQKVLPTGIQTGGLSGTGEIIISVLIQALIIGALGFALFMLARAGFNMMTSGGDKEKFAQGRERLRYAIIGLLIIFFSFFIISFFGQLFGIKLINTSSSTCGRSGQPCCGASCNSGLICAPDGFCDPLSPSIPTSVPILTKQPTPPSNVSPTKPTSPTPTPKFLMPGESINNTFSVMNSFGTPQKRKIDCTFIGGDSANIITEIRVPAISGKVFRTGEVISFSDNATNVIIQMTARPGASPICFDSIFCDLISAESTSTGEPIERRDLGRNICISDTLTAFFSNHRFPQVSGNRTVFSELLLFNTAKIAQKATFEIGSGCFPAAQRQFFIGSTPITPNTIQTIQGNGGIISIRMESILPFGTTPVPTGITPSFSCPVTIKRILE